MQALYPSEVAATYQMHQTTNTPFTRYNRLSYRLTTGLTTVLNEQPLSVQPVVKPGCTIGLTTGCIHDTAGCQTGCQTGLTTGCIHDTVGCQTGCQTGLTTGWMFVYTIQPVVEPVWQPVRQQVVSCKRGFTHTRLLPTFRQQLYFFVKYASIGLYSSVSKFHKVVQFQVITSMWTRLPKIIEQSRGAAMN